MEIVFVTGQAEVFFSKEIRSHARSPEDAVAALEKQFLDKRARRVNDAVWSELTFDFLRRKREADGQSTRYQAVLADLLTQISQLGEMRTGSRSDDDIASKTLEAVKGIKAFAGICANPPEEVQALHSALRSRALEVDHESIQKGSKNTDAGLFKQEPDEADLSDADRAAEEAYESFFTDRKLRYPRDDSRRRPVFRGYGRGERGNRRFSKGPRGLPSNVCRICFEKNCHSSKHKQTSRLVDAVVRICTEGGNESDKDGDEEVDADEEAQVNFSVFASDVRATVAMGVTPKESSIIIDAAMIDTGS